MALTPAEKQKHYRERQSALARDRSDPIEQALLQDVERCERGIDLAASQATLQEVMSSFYRECSDTCAEPACRQGFLEAAAAPPKRPMVSRRVSVMASSSTAMAFSTSACGLGQLA